MTIITTSFSSINTDATVHRSNDDDPYAATDAETDIPDDANAQMTTSRRERETHVTLDIPVVVLSPTAVSGLHEPRCREPDVHIYLPPLQQLKSISDRFARLASSNAAGPNAAFGAGASRFRANAGDSAGTGLSAKGPKLDLAATMHGTLRLSLPSSPSSHTSGTNTSTTSDHLSISSTWRGLENPELDAGQIGGEDALATHPSTRMREVVPSEDDEGPGWAKVRIDARDWSRVLGVGRVGGRVVGCEFFFIFLLYSPRAERASPKRHLQFCIGVA